MAGANLTAMQEKFIAEYLVDLNITQAAKRAGYSEKTAYRIGAELLQKPHVLARLKKEQEKRMIRVNRTADDVLKDIQDVGKEAREAGEFNNALKALELEAKHHGMFTAKLEVSGALDIAALLERGKKVASGS